MAVQQGKKEVFLFDEWVPLTVISVDQVWTSYTCQAILAPNICVPLLLGNPFLAMNGMVIDHKLHTCIDKKNGYDLVNPPAIKCTTIKPCLTFGPELRKQQKLVIADISTLFSKTLQHLDSVMADQVLFPIAAIQTQIEHLITELDEVMWHKDSQFKEHCLDLFPPNVPML